MTTMPAGVCGAKALLVGIPGAATKSAASCAWAGVENVDTPRTQTASPLSLIISSFFLRGLRCCGRRRTHTRFSPHYMRRAARRAGTDGGILGALRRLRLLLQFAPMQVLALNQQVGDVVLVDVADVGHRLAADP